MILDDHIVIAGLIVLIPFAIFYQLWKRKVMGIEAAIPEFLDRMAGINEMGLTIAQGLALMVRTNLGILSYEIKRIKRDMDWGANVEEALDPVRAPDPDPLHRKDRHPHHQGELHERGYRGGPHRLRRATQG